MFIEAALELGIDTVKFFPAEASGGIKMIKSIIRTLQPAKNNALQEELIYKILRLSCNSQMYWLVEVLGLLIKN